MVGHVAAFNVPGYEGCYRRLSASSVNSPNLAGALRPMARSFQQPERIAVVGVMASSGQQSQPRSRHAAGIQKARAAITDSLSLLRSSEQQEDLVGVYDEMMIDKTGRMAKIIRVPEAFVFKEGARVTDDLVAGKLLGDGVQGQVYVLKRPNGDSTDQLLKVMKYKPATPVTGMDVAMEREWLIGQQIDKLAGEDGDIPGIGTDPDHSPADWFVQTGAGIVTGQGENTKFLGLLMGKINGKELEKRLWKDESWADAKYTLEMLRQVLTALDVAGRELGFVHGDMRIANIMEHRPRDDAQAGDNEFVPRGFKADVGKLQSADEFKLPGEEAAVMSFKVIDFGHARLIGDKPGASLPGSPQMEKWYRRWFAGKGDVWRLLQDLGDTIDGRSWPEDQAVEVWLLLGLIREVTNVQLTPFFHRPGEPDRRGWSWERIGGLGHVVRRLLNRAKAFLFATKTGYTASEALAFLKRHSRKAVYNG